MIITRTKRIEGAISNYLQQHIRAVLGLACLEELFDEQVVGLAAVSRLLQPHVRGVCQQLLPVRANINVHWQALKC